MSRGPTRQGLPWSHALTLIFLGTSALWAQARAERSVYLGELRKRSPETARVLRVLEAEGVTPTQLQAALDALYREQVGDTVLRARLDAKSAPREARYLGARAWAEAQLRRRLAQLGAALRDHQCAGAGLALSSQAPPKVNELMARWPLAPQALAAAKVTWGRAVARGDMTAAQELRVWSQRWHPEAPAWPARPQPALPKAVAIAAGSRLVLVESSAFEPGASRGGPNARCLPSLVGDTVVVSDGARLHLYSRQGATRGSFPLSVKAASSGPDSSTPFEARVSSWGNLAFAPLLLDGPLAPARRKRLADGSFAGRYYSLIGFNVQKGRLSWWDGDAGRRQERSSIHGGKPPGWEETSLLETLRGAHTLACAVGPERVYVAYTIQSQDPELYVMAYTRESGEGAQLALRPAWRAPAHLLTTERKRGDATDPLLAPEVSAALSLHPEAGLLLSTDVGVVAAISPREGEVRWLRRVAPGRSRLTLPAEPALAAGPQAVAYLYRGRIVSLDATTGLLRWARALGNMINSPRHLLDWGDALVVTGGPELWWLRKQDGAPLGGKLLAQRSRAVGRCARVGERLLIPNWVQGPRSALLVLDSKTRAITQRLELPGFAGYASVQAWGDTVVFAGTHRIAFFRWKSESRDPRRRRAGE